MIELTRDLGRESSGDDVKQVQEWLGLSMSGYFDKNTVRVVRAFQKEHGLVVDGIVGQVTWEKLIEVFERPSPPAEPDPAHDYDYSSQPDDPGPVLPKPDRFNITLIAWAIFGAILIAMVVWA